MARARQVSVHEGLAEDEQRRNHHASKGRGGKAVKSIARAAGAGILARRPASKQGRVPSISAALTPPAVLFAGHRIGRPTLRNSTCWIVCDQPLAEPCKLFWAPGKPLSALTSSQFRSDRHPALFQHRDAHRRPRCHTRKAAVRSDLWNGFTSSWAKLDAWSIAPRRLRTTEKIRKIGVLWVCQNQNISQAGLMLIVFRTLSPPPPPKKSGPAGFHRSLQCRANLIGKVHGAVATMASADF